MRVDKASCTHFCKWDDNATGGRWFECVILSESDDEYKVRVFDGECGDIPKGSISEKANQGDVEAGDFVVAYYDDRDYAFQGVCTGAGDGGVVVEFADGDTGMAYEGRVWKLNPM